MKLKCIYHANCSDGFAAAYAVNEWALKNNYTDVEFIPANYDDVPVDVKGCTVYIVDFSYPRDILEQMAKDADKLTVIDHHISAQTRLEGLDYCIFDMNHSGAVLTWKTLFGDTNEMPTLLKYIEDRDLWKWDLPGSKEISAALRSYPMTFEVWDAFMDWDGLNRLKNEGIAILRYIRQQVSEAIEGGVQMQEIGGYTVPVVNTRHFHSEVGNTLMEAGGYPFVATYMDVANKRIYSLRSNAQGIAVNTIAEQYGGGGHRDAAGFQTSLPIREEARSD